MRSWLFETITRACARRPWTVLAVAALVTLLSMVGIGQIVPKTGLADIMDPEAPLSQLQARIDKNFPGVYTVTVVIEGTDHDRMVDAAKALEERLRADTEHVRDVYLEQPVDFFVEHGLLYATTEDLHLLESMVSDWEPTVKRLWSDPSTLGLLTTLREVGERQVPGPSNILTLNSKAYSQVLLGDAPSDKMGVGLNLQLDTSPLRKKLEAGTMEMLRSMPLPPSQEKTKGAMKQVASGVNLLADVLEKGEGMPPDEFRDRFHALRDIDYKTLTGGMDRYNFSLDGKMLVLDVAAVANISNVDAATPFVHWLREQVDEASAPFPDMTFGLTGLPVMLIEESESIIDNFALVTVLGFIGILAVFVVGFERVALPSLAAIPLVVGVLWMLGVQGFVIGSVNLFSMMVPVLLFSLGIDFAIHLLSGYAEKRDGGLEPEEALRATFLTIGDGILTGALTTAAAFLTLMASDAYSNRALGFTAGVGVITALIAMLTVLPALMILWDRRMSGKGQMLPNVPFTFLGPLGDLLQRQRYPVLGIFLVATIALAYFTGNVRLDRNYMNALPQNMPALTLQNKMIEAYGQSNQEVVLLADDLADAERIRKAASEAGTVATVFSASALLPPDQESKRPYLTSIAARLDPLRPTGEPPKHDYTEADLAIIKDQLAIVKGVALDMSLLAAVLYDDETQQAIGQIRDDLNRIDGMLVPAAATRIQHLDTLLAEAMSETVSLVDAMTSSDPVTVDDLPASVVTRLHGEDGSWIVLVRANGDVWEQDFRESFLEEIQRIEPDHAGIVPSWDIMLREIVGDLPRLMGLIMAAVALLVVVDLRSIKGTLLSLTPLAVGLVWTLGVIALIDEPFNILSVISVPILVGIGLDNGVHIYHRIRHEGAVGPALVHTGKAVLLTTLTTGIGFGSLTLSIHPGLYSLGLITSIGIFACLLLAIFLLPALIAIFQEDILTGGKE